MGSSNIDPFSLLLAREANVFVMDASFARQLRQSLRQAMEGGAIAVPPANWPSQPLRSRLAIWASYAIVRILMGMFGYGGQH